MAKEEPTQCTACGVTLTVKHIITECHKYSDELRKYNIPTNMSEALGPDIENISNMWLVFLRKIDFHSNQI